MPKVTFVNEKTEIEVPQGSNLRKEAMKQGIQVYSGIHRFANCMGFGLCGTCTVVVKEGMENLSSKGMLEKVTLTIGFSNIGQEKDMRLSCQCQVNGDCQIVTQPPFNWSGENFWQKPYPNK